MDWTDSAIVISASKYGESALIVQLLTGERGLHAGLVRSARKAIAICQKGNFVDAKWKGRLEEHLGNFTIEMRKPLFAEIFDEALKLDALNSACALVKLALPEREPHYRIFESLSLFLASMETGNFWMHHYVELELELLKRLGYGLDLSECAATGDKNSLFYVSPKSGRAVSKDGGEEYKDKLLKLPEFLRPIGDETHDSSAGNITEIIDGTVLTRYFLEKHVFRPQNVKIPPARDRFVQKLKESVL